MRIFSILLSLHLILLPVAFADDCASQGQDCYKTTGDGSVEGAKKYVNNIMMTASGIIGSNFIGCTPKSYTWSHYVFMAGAITLLVSEIVAATKEKERKEEENKQLQRQGLVGQKPGNYVTQEQKDAQLTLLNTAKEEETANRDALKERMDWMTAVEVVYWAAVASAAVEIVLYALEEYTGYSDWGLDCTDGMDKMTTAAISAAYGLIPGLVAGDVGGAAMKGITAGGFSYMLNSMTGEVGTVIRTAAKTAPGRVLEFGVFAALSEIAREGLKERKDQASKNIELIESAIANWKNANTETTVINPGDGNGNGGQNNNGHLANNPIQALPSAHIQTNPCMGNSGSGFEYSENACKNQFKFDRSKMDFRSGFLGTIGNQSLDMAEKMMNGNISGARVDAASLAKNAAKIKAEAKSIIAQANDKLKALGKTPIDFENELQSHLASLNKSGMDALAASGIKGLGGGPTAALSSSQLNSKENSSSTVNAPKSVKLKSSAPVINLGGAQTAEEKADLAKAGSEFEDLEINHQDISKNDEVSLFKRVSHRYMRSYSKLFEKKQRPKAEEAVKK